MCDDIIFIKKKYFSFLKWGIWGDDFNGGFCFKSNEKVGW